MCFFVFADNEQMTTIPGSIRDNFWLFFDIAHKELVCQGCLNSWQFIYKMVVELTLHALNYSNGNTAKGSWDGAAVKEKT